MINQTQSLFWRGCGALEMWDHMEKHRWARKYSHMHIIITHMYAYMYHVGLVMISIDKLSEKTIIIVGCVEVFKFFFCVCVMSFDFFAN